MSGGVSVPVFSRILTFSDVRSPHTYWTGCRVGAAGERTGSPDWSSNNAWWVQMCLGRRTADRSPERGRFRQIRDRRHTPKAIWPNV